MLSNGIQKPQHTVYFTSEYVNVHKTDRQADDFNVPPTPKFEELTKKRYYNLTLQ